MITAGYKKRVRVELFIERLVKARVLEMLMVIV